MAPQARPEPPQRPVAQRINQLPSQLQALAEDMDMGGDDAGEMWGDEEFSSSMPTSTPMQPQAPSLNIDHAAKMADVDFSRARRLMEMTDSPKPKESASDRLAKAQWEQQRIDRMREQLDRKA